MPKKKEFRVPVEKRFDQYQEDGAHRDKPSTVKSSTKAITGVKGGDNIRIRRQDIGKGGEAADRYRRERMKLQDELNSLEERIAKIDAAHDAYMELNPSPSKEQNVDNQVEIAVLKPKMPEEIPTLEELADLDDITG
jgi:hypothetical protein